MICMKVIVKTKGDWRRTRSFLNRSRTLPIEDILRKYGEQGVKHLEQNTPKDSRITSKLWTYTLEETSRGYQIVFLNDSFNRGYQIAVGIQYGHGTRGGTWVKGYDYINPVTMDVMMGLASEIWREVVNDG